MEKKQALLSFHALAVVGHNLEAIKEKSKKFERNVTNNGRIKMETIHNSPYCKSIMKSDDYQALSALKYCYGTMKSSYEKNFQSGIMTSEGKVQFINECEQAIKQCESILSKHRGILSFLKNAVNEIAKSIGIEPPIKTDSSKIINNMKEALDNYKHADKKTFKELYQLVPGNKDDAVAAGEELDESARNNFK